MQVENINDMPQGNDLVARAKGWFDNYPTTDELYFTSDNLCFFFLHLAKKHAEKLDNNSVATITRNGDINITNEWREDIISAKPSLNYEGQVSKLAEQMARAYWGEGYNADLIVRYILPAKIALEEAAKMYRLGWFDGCKSENEEFEFDSIDDKLINLQCRRYGLIKED